jgi:hypothetical protein
MGVYHEFPKALYRADGTSCVVYTPAEEAAVEVAWLIQPPRPVVLIPGDVPFASPDSSVDDAVPSRRKRRP